MRRNQIKITNEVIIKYCKREHVMQGKVYPKQVESGRMTAYEANQNFAIISEVKELAEALHLKGYNWQELKKFVNDLPAQRTIAEQQKLGL